VISEKRYQDAKKFLYKVNRSENHVVSSMAVIKHMSYLVNHIKTTKEEGEQ